ARGYSGRQAQTCCWRGWVHVMPASWPKADILLSTYVGFRGVADITKTPRCPLMTAGIVKPMDTPLLRPIDLPHYYAGQRALNGRGEGRTAACCYPCGRYRGLLTPYGRR